VTGSSGVGSGNAPGANDPSGDAPGAPPSDSPATSAPGAPGSDGPTALDDTGMLGFADGEPYVVVDDSPETLIDVRRTEEHPEPFGHPGRPLKRNQPFYIGFVGALGVFAAYALVQAVANARSVLVLIAVSLFLAVGLNPIVEWLMARGLRRSFAVAAVFAGFLLAFVGFCFAVIPPVVEESQQFAESIPDIIDDLERSQRLSELNEQFGVLDNARTYAESGQLGSRAFGGLLGVGKVVVGAVFSAFTILILTLYFLASLPSIKRQAYRLAPSSRRERVWLIGDEILARIGGYVNGAFSVATIAGVTSYVFLSIVELDYALALSLLVGMLCLIPMIGATMAGATVCTVAFFHSISVGIACVVFYVVYQQVENYVIYPRVMKKTVDVPAAVTIMAALVGGALLGVVGALLAIPIAAAVLLVVREVVIPRQDRV
jgi:predicted PurR-regulated permease PerM